MAGDGKRSRTLGMICEVLHRLSTQQDAAGEHEAAVQPGRRLVALDPLSEFGQRTLMRAYARAGRRGEAMRQYKSCAETLKRSWGSHRTPKRRRSPIKSRWGTAPGPRAVCPMRGLSFRKIRLRRHAARRR